VAKVQFDFLLLLSYDNKNEYAKGRSTPSQLWRFLVALWYIPMTIYYSPLEKTEQQKIALGNKAIFCCSVFEIVRKSNNQWIYHSIILNFIRTYTYSGNENTR